MKIGRAENLAQPRPGLAQVGISTQQASDWERLAAVGRDPLIDRTRARPIIRVHANIQFCNIQEGSESKFVCASFKTGRYGDDTEVHEIFVELKAENHGKKPLSLQHIYIEDGNGNLTYITADGLPLVLEGQSSAKFNIQKEYFDAFNISTKQRVIGDVLEVGFVDALDRRYPVSKKELNLILQESLGLPTSCGLLVPRECPERVLSAFQSVHKVAIVRRSERAERPNRKFPLSLKAIAKLWGAR